MKSIIPLVVALFASLLINAGLYFHVESVTYIINTLSIIVLASATYLLCVDADKMRSHVREVVNKFKTPSTGVLFMSGVLGLVSLQSILLLVLGGYHKTLVLTLVVSWVTVLLKNRMNVYIYNAAKSHLK